MATCNIQRFDDHIVLEVWHGDAWLFRYMAPLDDEDVGIDASPDELFEIAGIDDAEYVALEFPPGLPTGYRVFTFYRGKGSARRTIKSILYGPEGIVGEFSTPELAVVAALSLEPKADQVDGTSTTLGLGG